MKYLLIPFTALTLVACQGTGTTTTTSPTDQNNGEYASSSGIDGIYYGGEGYRPDPASGYNTASDGNFYDNPGYGANVVAGPNSPAKDRVIYFAYNSSDIDSRAVPIIEKNAVYLRQNPTAKILLEGHTDSRGSREYNIALGERRAISVLKRFTALGVPASQIRLISYGEERLAVQGYNEQAFQRNRRVVIQY